MEVQARIVDVFRRATARAMSERSRRVGLEELQFLWESPRQRRCLHSSTIQETESRSFLARPAVNDRGAYE